MVFGSPRKMTSEGEELGFCYGVRRADSDTFETFVMQKPDVEVVRFEGDTVIVEETPVGREFRERGLELVKIPLSDTRIDKVWLQELARHQPHRTYRTRTAIRVVEEKK
jgi:hypothetical protein